MVVVLIKEADAKKTQDRTKNADSIRSILTTTTEPFKKVKFQQMPLLPCHDAVNELMTSTAARADEWNHVRDRWMQDETLLSQISLPTLKYGYAKEPLTWEQLQDIILVQKDLARLSRSCDQQREYEVFRQYFLKRQYESVLDFILISKFDFERRQNHQGRWQAYPSLKDSTMVQTKLVINDFPYYMADGISHHILWKTKESITLAEIENAIEELGRPGNLVDTLHWINPPHLQSLPEIDHVHILCRSKETSR